MTAVDTANCLLLPCATRAPNHRCRRPAGFTDAAYASLLHWLADAAAAAHASADAPCSGCPVTLCCLKLGPPADQPLFGERAVASIAALLQAAPQLEAVEVLGLSAEAAGALLPVWLHALERRSQQGCTVPADGGALRLGRVVE